MNWKIIASNMIYNLSKFHFDTLTSNGVVLFNFIYYRICELGLHMYGDTGTNYEQFDVSDSILNLITKFIPN